MIAPVPSPSPTPSSALVTSPSLSPVQVTSATTVTAPDGFVIEVQPADSSGWWLTAAAVAAVVAALIAAVATIWVGLLGRRTGKEASKNAADANFNAQGAVTAAERASTAAERGAGASERSAEAAVQAAAAAERGSHAAEKSAHAAQASVDVNRETAVAVGKRAGADALSKRYQDAAEQLGHEHAAVQLAGVYAMERLADDWPEQRQTCIELLLAYLRLLAQDSVSLGSAASDQVVREAIQAVLSLHLRRRAALSWSNQRFDFRNTRFDDFKLALSRFERPTYFRNTSFSGHCSLNIVEFLQGGVFEDVHVNGRLDLEALSAKHRLELRDIYIAPKAILYWGAVEHSKQIRFERVRVAGLLRVALPEISEHKDSDSKSERLTIIKDCEILDGGEVQFTLGWLQEVYFDDFDDFKWPTLVLDGWRLSSGSKLLFPPEVLNRGVIRFMNPKFDSAAVTNFLLHPLENPASDGATHTA